MHLDYHALLYLTLTPTDAERRGKWRFYGEFGEIFCLLFLMSSEICPFQEFREEVESSLPFLSLASPLQRQYGWGIFSKYGFLIQVLGIGLEIFFSAHVMLSLQQFSRSWELFSWFREEALMNSNVSYMYKNTNFSHAHFSSNWIPLSKTLKIC